MGWLQASQSGAGQTPHRDCDRYLALWPPPFKAGWLVKEARFCWIAIILTHDLIRKPVSTFRDHARAGGADGSLLRADQMSPRQVLRGREQTRGRRDRLGNLLDR